MLSFHIIMESIFYCGSIVMLSGNISTVSQEVLEKKEFLQRRMREKNYAKNLVCRQKNGNVFLAELNEAPQVIQEEEIVGHIALDWEQLGEWIRDGKITDGFTLAAYAKMSLQK